MLLDRHRVVRLIELADLERHLTGTERVLREEEVALKAAMGLFLGEHAPHAWPIRRAEIEAVGIPVKESADRWSGLIDGMRGRMRVRMTEEAP